MATYYMRADGTAGNKGAATSDAAASTSMSISTHNGESFSPGDIIIVSDAGGKYRGNVIYTQDAGSSGNPITYLGSGSPEVAGAGLVTGWETHDTNIWKKTSWTGYCHDSLWVDGNHGDQKTSLGALADNYDWYLDDGADTIYLYDDTGDPDNRTSPGIEICNSVSHGMRIDHDYTVVDGILFEKGTYSAIRCTSTTGANYVTLRNLTTQWSADGASIEFNTTSGGTPGGNITIEDCICRWANTGINISWEYANVTIRRNHCYENKYHDNEYCSGIKCFGGSSTMDYLDIYDNICHDNGRGLAGDYQGRGAGIWLDAVNASNWAKIHHNLCYDNAGNGIFIEITSKARVWANVGWGNATNDGAGTEEYCPASIVVDTRDVYSSNNNTVHNNTFYGGRIGLKCTSYGMVSSTLNNNIFKNNIFVGASIRNFYARYGGDNDGVWGTGNVYENNCFGAEASNFIKWAGTDCDTYDEWEMLVYEGGYFQLSKTSSTFGIQAGTAKAQAIEFSPKSNVTLTSIKSWHRRVGTPDDATLRLQIWDESGGEPNAIVTNGELTQEIAQTLTQDAGGEEVTWTFSTGPTLVGGETYFLVFDGDWTPDGSNHVQVFGEYSYSGPYHLWYRISGVWTEVDNDSLYFQIFTDVSWDGASGSIESDPAFTDAANGDFTLRYNSPCCNAGTNLGSDYDDALDKRSTWPKQVLTLDQDDVGTAWDVGAYVQPFYTTGNVYYMRADGTAANKGAATSDAAASTAMDLATHNAQTYSPGDTIIVSDKGGNFDCYGEGTSLYPPSDGSAAGHIQYIGSGDPIIETLRSVSTWVSTGTSNVWKHTGLSSFGGGMLWIDDTLGDRKFDASLSNEFDYLWDSAGAYYDTSANTLYLYCAAGDPDTEYTTIATPGRDRAASCEKDYLLFDGITFQHANYAALRANTQPGDNCIVRNCICQWANNDGMQTAGTAAYDNWLIEDNIFRWNTVQGLAFSYRGRNSTIRRNLAYENDLYQGWGQYTGGIKMFDSTAVAEGNVFEYNVCHSNGRKQSGDPKGQGVGIWFDSVEPTTDRNIIRYNLIYDNGGCGIFLEICDDADVYGNVGWGNATADGNDNQYCPASIVIDTRSTYHSNGNRVYNNTFYGGRMGFQATCYTLTSCDLSNNLVRNNIFVGWTEHGAYFNDGGDNDGVWGSGNVYEYNCFGSEQADMFQWGGNGTNNLFHTYDDLEMMAAIDSQVWIQSGWNQNSYFVQGTSDKWQGIEVPTTGSGTVDLKYVRIRARKIGTPDSNTMRCKVYDDNSGPDQLVGEATLDISGLTTDTNGEFITFTFSTPVTLTLGDTYYVVGAGDWTPSDSNCVAMFGYFSGYSGVHHQWYYDGSWTEQGTDRSSVLVGLDTDFSDGWMNNVEADPEFVDQPNNNYALRPGSPCIGAGTDLGDSYDDGLHRQSEWPKAVYTVDQDDYGSWDLGAYVYTGQDPPSGGGGAGPGGPGGASSFHKLLALLR